MAIRRSGGTRDLELHGDIDLAARPTLYLAAATAIDPETEEIDIDGHDVSFIDAAALGAILSVQQIAHQCHLGFRLTAASAPMARVIDMAGVEHRLRPPGSERTTA